MASGCWLVYFCLWYYINVSNTKITCQIKKIQFLELMPIFFVLDVYLTTWKETMEFNWLFSVFVNMVWTWAGLISGLCSSKWALGCPWMLSHPQIMLRWQTRWSQARFLDLQTASSVKHCQFSVVKYFRKKYEVQQEDVPGYCPSVFTYENIHNTEI